MFGNNVVPDWVAGYPERPINRTIEDMRLMYRRMGRNAAIKFGSEIFGRIAIFLLFLYAARVLSPSGFGRYAYALALGFVVAQLADFGLQTLISREVAVHKREATPLIHQAFRLKCALSCVVLVILLLLSWGDPFHEQLIILLFGSALLLQTFVEFAAYIFRGMEQLHYEAGLLSGLRVLTAILGGLVLLLGGDLLQLAIATILATLITLACAFYLLQANGWTRTTPDFWSTHAQTSLLKVDNLLRHAAPLGIATFLSIAFTRTAVLLLETRADALAVGHFAAAYRLIEPAHLLPASLIAAFFPVLSHAVEHEPKRAKLLMGQMVAVLGGGALLGAIIIWFGAPFIIPPLYGDAFAPSVRVWQLLGLTLIPAFVNNGLIHYLIARHQQRFLIYFTFLMLSLHVVATWQLIPLWGALAPAYSMIAAECVLLLCCCVALWSRPHHTIGQVKHVH